MSHFHFDAYFISNTQYNRRNVVSSFEFRHRRRQCKHGRSARPMAVWRKKYETSARRLAKFLPLYRTAYIDIRKMPACFPCCARPAPPLDVMMRVNKYAEDTFVYRPFAVILPFNNYRPPSPPPPPQEDQGAMDVHFSSTPHLSSDDDDSSGTLHFLAAPYARVVIVIL